MRTRRSVALLACVLALTLATAGAAQAASCGTFQPAGNVTLEVGEVGSYDFSSGGATFTATMDWGDGATSTASLSPSHTTDSVSHSYSSVGTYSVNLSVSGHLSDGTPCSDKVSIAKATVVAPPVASFVANPSPATVGQSVGFDASGSSDPDNDIDTYVWDFGDGATGAGKTASHSYSTPGTYTAKLTVTDKGNRSDQTTRSVTVNSASSPPSPPPPPPPPPPGPSTPTDTPTSGTPNTTQSSGMTLVPLPAAFGSNGAFSLPSTRQCTSKRLFPIRIRQKSGLVYDYATVSLNGKRVKIFVRSKRKWIRTGKPKGSLLNVKTFRGYVDLRGFAKGRYAVRIVVLTVDGRTISGTRRYRTCTGKLRGSVPKL
ncbi:MAG: PKD domain-containing protein [Anaeromyxobacteraceae bacterium]